MWEDRIFKFFNV